MTWPKLRCKVVVMKKIAAVITAVAMGVTLVGCASSEKDADIDTGVVVKSYGKTVTVLEDDGETDKHRVTRTTARKCSVGERWPDCKRS